MRTEMNPQRCPRQLNSQMYRAINATLDWNSLAAPGRTNFLRLKIRGLQADRKQSDKQGQEGIA